MRRFRERVSIQAPRGEPDRTDAGDVVDVFDTVTGLESVPATIVRATQETFGDRFTTVTDRFEIVLAGYRPQVVPAMRVLDANNTAYDIKSVAPTIGRRATVLSVELVSI